MRDRFAAVKGRDKSSSTLRLLLLYTGLALSEPCGSYRAWECYIRRRFDTAAPISVKSVDSLNILEKKAWLSAWTCAVSFDFTLYNFKIDVLQERRVTIFGAGTREGLLYLVGQILLIGCVVMYMLGEMFEFVDSRKTAKPLKHIQ